MFPATAADPAPRHLTDVSAGAPDSESLSDAAATAGALLAGARVCLLVSDQPSAIETAELNGFAEVLPRCGVVVDVVRFTDVHDLYSAHTARQLQDCDVVVKFTHGPFNRIGLLPAVLATLGVTAAGHPTRVDLLSQHKSVVKHVMRRMEVPTLECVLAYGGSDVLDRVTQLGERTRSREFVVKPDDGNASKGLHWAESVTRAAQFVQDARGPMLVEPYVRGRIVTVGTVNVEGQVFTLDPLEYLLHDRPVMDAAWKKTPQRAPAELAPEMDAQLRAYAGLVHQAVGANGLTRTDFILGATPTCLEINTNIGLGPSHDIAQAFAATGLRYQDLVICQTASGLPRTGQR